MHKLNEQIFINKIQEDPHFLKNIQPSQQTKAICLAAIRLDPSTLKYVKNQTEELCLVAVNKDPLALQYVSNQTEKIFSTAFNKNYSAINYLKLKNTATMEMAVKRCGLYALDFFQDLYEEAAILIASSDPQALSKITKQTEKICLAAVTTFGLSLSDVKNQTAEICLAAVRQNGSALQYVENQTEEICLAAVKSYGVALRFVKYQTAEMIAIAIDDCKNSFNYADMNLYKYNPEQIIDIYSHMMEYPVTSIGQFFLKLSELLSSFSDEDLVKAVRYDLCQIFEDQLDFACESESASGSDYEVPDCLINIVQKVKMIESLSDSQKSSHQHLRKII